MKKAINAWALYGPCGSAMTVAEAIRQAKDMGYEGVELTATSKELNLQTTESDCARIRDCARDTGIVIASLASGDYWTTSLSSNEKEVRERAIAFTGRYMELASWLGVKNVLVVPGAAEVPFDPQAEVVPYDEALRNSRSSLKRCEKMAAKAKVCLCLENVWNHLFLSPLEMRDFVASFRSRWVGSYFDAANVKILGRPEDWIKILGKKIKAVHVKNWKGEDGAGTLAGFGESILEGDVDWKSVLRALKSVGYDGWLTVEMATVSPGPAARASKDLDTLIQSAGDPCLQ